jgi:hypothetical protein
VLAFVLSRQTPRTKDKTFDPSRTRIRCPRCAWEPRQHDRWFCSPGCLCQWNTFATAGICPQCSKHWEQTACLACHQWSPHADWYADYD